MAKLKVNKKGTWYISTDFEVHPAKVDGGASSKRYYPVRMAAVATRHRD